MKKGTLVEVTFLDHTQGPFRHEGHGPATCKAVGWVFEDNPTFLSLSAWISVTLDDEGCDSIAIVKHPEMKIRRLK